MEEWVHIKIKVDREDQMSGDFRIITKISNFLNKDFIRFLPIYYIYRAKICLICGHRSNIPICCIVWFVTFMNVVQAINPLFDWYIRKTPPLFDYFPCPICILRKKVNIVKQCNCRICLVDQARK